MHSHNGNQEFVSIDAAAITIHTLHLITAAACPVLAAASAIAKILLRVSAVSWWYDSLRASGHSLNDMTNAR